MTNMCNKPEHPVCPKLPFVEDIQMIKCANLIMNDGKNYIIKENDLVAIQFIRPDNHIVIRKGRIKDFNIVNKRELSNKVDNLSRIILDCSEQFSVKIIEIKIKDVIAIGDIDCKFPNYDNRIEELTPNYLEGDLEIPARENGMITKEEDTSKNEVKKKATRGFAITR